MEPETIYGLVGLGLGIGVSYAYFRSRTRDLLNQINNLFRDINNINYTDRRKTLEVRDSLRSFRNTRYDTIVSIDHSGINQCINSIEDKLVEERK